jgi:hypothetical protein
VQTYLFTRRATWHLENIAQASFRSAVLLGVSKTVRPVHSEPLGRGRACCGSGSARVRLGFGLGSAARLARLGYSKEIVEEDALAPPNSARRHSVLPSDMHGFTLEKLIGYVYIHIYI